jgi:hypothetical protein
LGHADESVHIESEEYMRMPTLGSQGSQRRRAYFCVLGFLVAPLISAVIFSATSPILESLGLIARAGMVPVFYFYSLLPTIVLGVPAFVLLFKLRMIRWWTSIGVGLVIGGVMALLVEGSHRLRVPELVFMALTRAASTFAFWLIWLAGDGHAQASN